MPSRRVGNNHSYFFIKNLIFLPLNLSSQDKSPIPVRNLIQKVNKVLVFGSIRLLRLGKLERIRFLEINLDFIFPKRQNFRTAYSTLVSPHGYQTKKQSFGSNPTTCPNKKRGLVSYPMICPNKKKAIIK